MSYVRCPMSDVLWERRLLWSGHSHGDKMITRISGCPDIGHRTSDIGHRE
jgi:hypothetical protein